MSLAGEGAVAIWHDIAPEGRAQFYDWHGREHMQRIGKVPRSVAGVSTAPAVASIVAIRLSGRVHGSPIRERRGRSQCRRWGRQSV